MGTKDLTLVLDSSCIDKVNNNNNNNMGNILFFC